MQGFEQGRVSLVSFDRTPIDGGYVEVPTLRVIDESAFPASIPLGGTLEVAWIERHGAVGGVFEAIMYNALSCGPAASN